MPTVNIKRALFWTLLAPVLLITIAVIYYQFDEGLRPEVAALVNTKPNPVPDALNGYYPMLGLSAPADVEPRRMGLDIVAAASKRFTDTGAKSLEATVELPGSHAIPPRHGAIKLCANNKAPACLSEVRKNQQAARELVKANSLVLKRYREVHAYPEFQETGYLYPFSDAMTMHKIFQADIALKWDAKNYGQALALLRDEQAFWRRAMSSDASLIVRIIGLTIMQRNLHFVAELTADCAGCMGDSVSLQSILSPLNPAEMSIRKVIGHEARLMYSTLDSSLSEAKQKSLSVNLVYSLAFKKNATVNKIAGNYARAVQLSECPLQEYAACYTAYTRNASGGIDYFSWKFLDDPVGMFATEDTATLVYSEYIFAAVKYETLRQLVLARYHLGKDKIKAEGVATWLQQHSKEYTNPVSGKPIEWDAAQRVLRMSFPDEIKQKPIEVSL